jgi:outer membrane protein
MVALLVWLAMLVAPQALRAQSTEVATGDWALRVRASLSASSYASDPGGYKIYSALATDVSVIRSINGQFSAEVALRTESREVDGPLATGSTGHLGSVEMLPVNALVQWRPLGRHDTRYQPYAGVGLNVTATWEKSGALDSASIPVSWGPAAQLGVDFRVGSRALLNLDAKWNLQKVHIRDYLASDPSVELDPFTLGAGIGVAF